MKAIPSILAVAAAGGLLWALAPRAQTQADSRPLSIKVVDLPADFQPMRLGMSGSGGYMEQVMGIMPMMMRSSANSLPGYLAFSDVVYTKGERVQVYGQEYLATYRLPVNYLSMYATGDADRLIANPPTELGLHYVKVENIQSLTPAPEAGKDALMSALGVGPGRTVFDDAKEAASKTATLSNSKQIALSFLIYASDYDDVFPYTQNTLTAQVVTEPYLKNREVWKTRNPNGGEFLYNLAVAGVAQTQIPNPAEVVLLFESKDWPTGERAIAYTDSHAKMVKTGAAQAIAKSRALKFKKTGKPLPLMELPK